MVALDDARRVARDTVHAYAWWLRAELAARPPRQAPVRPVAGRSVVLLAWSFPPRVSGGTYRPLALANRGRALGWDVSVVGAEPSGLPSAAGRHLATTVSPDVSVARVRRVSLEPHPRWFPRIDDTFLSALATFETARQAFGDSRPAAVVASGPPFHMFVSGYYLANALRCPLVLDYRDEWTECPFDFVRPGRWDRWWERRCLRAADAVVFVTRSQLEHQLRVFPALTRSKCVVIPNGWEPADEDSIEDTRPDPAGDGAPMVLSFVGTLGAFAAPGRFLAAANDVLRARPDLKRRLRLRFVGRKEPQALEELLRFPHQEILEIVDEVPKPVATRMLTSSAALVLLNPPGMARYIPGKLYEYLAARRPVVVFGDGGEAAALVRQLDAGVVIGSGDVTGLERALDQLANGELDPPRGHAFDTWLAGHTRERMASEFFGLLEEIVEGSRPPGR